MKNKRFTSFALTLCVIMGAAPLWAQNDLPSIPDALLNIDVPPPPTGPPPKPPEGVMFFMMVSGLPKPDTGTSIGGRLSSIGYFLDADIVEFSGSITNEEITGWIHYKNLGWVYLEKYSKYELELVLNSPRLGWLYFPVTGSSKSTFFSYSHNKWLNYVKDEESGLYYYYNLSNDRWEVLHF